MSQFLAQWNPLFPTFAFVEIFQNLQNKEKTVKKSFRKETDQRRIPLYKDFLSFAIPVDRHYHLVQMSMFHYSRTMYPHTVSM